MQRTRAHFCPDPPGWLTLTPAFPPARSQDRPDLVLRQFLRQLSSKPGEQYSHTSLQGGKFHFPTPALCLQAIELCAAIHHWETNTGRRLPAACHFLSEQGPRAPATVGRCLYFDIDMELPVNQGYLDPLARNHGGLCLAQSLSQVVCQGLSRAGLPLATARRLAGDCVWSSASGLVVHPAQSWSHTIEAWIEANGQQATRERCLDGGVGLEQGDSTTTATTTTAARSSFTVVFRSIRGGLVPALYTWVAARLQDICLLPPSQPWDQILDRGAKDARCLFNDKVNKVRRADCPYHGTRTSRQDQHQRYTKCRCVVVRARRPVLPVAALAWGPSDPTALAPEIQRGVSRVEFVCRGWICPPFQRQPPSLENLPSMRPVEIHPLVPLVICVSRALATEARDRGPREEGKAAGSATTGWTPPAVGAPQPSSIPCLDLLAWQPVPVDSPHVQAWEHTLGVVCGTAGMAVHTDRIQAGMDSSHGGGVDPVAWRGWCATRSCPCPQRSSPTLPYTHDSNRVSFFAHPYFQGLRITLSCSDDACREKRRLSPETKARFVLDPGQYASLLASWRA
jgi:hypothetical protein